MMKLNSKNWQRVRINRTNKVLTFTNDMVYRTKSDCEKDIKTNQYVAINLKNLNELLNSGYSISPEVNKSVLKTPQCEITPINEGVDLTDNPEVERQILEYAEKKRKQDIIKAFLTPVPQPKVQPFDLSKRHEKFERTGRKQALKALEIQRNDYCGLEA